jgi:hypothetical protein
MTLAGYLSDRVAGEIHTSSMQRIAFFDARKYHNRQLIVHHRDDSFRNTPVTAAKWAHEHYGNELILMERHLERRRLRTLRAPRLQRHREGNGRGDQAVAEAGRLMCLPRLTPAPARRRSDVSMSFNNPARSAACLDHLPAIA